MSTATATPLETVTPLVKDWCAAHADRIQACYLRDEPDGRVTMVVVDRQEVFDDILARALHEFVTAVYRSMNLIIDEWQAGPGPEERLIGVFPVKRAVRVFGD